MFWQFNWRNRRANHLSAGTCFEESSWKWQSPHGAAFWRLDDDACGPDWTKTFLAGWHNIVEKRCHYHWLFQSRARGHDEISRLHFRVGEASCCSTAISAIFFAVRGPSQVTSRPGITMIFFCDAFTESGGKLGFFRCHEHNRMKLGLEGLCGFCFFALGCRPVDQRSRASQVVPATPSFPHRYRSLLLLLSVLACSEESAPAGYVAELQRSQFLCRSAR